MHMLSMLLEGVDFAFFKCAWSMPSAVPSTREWWAFSWTFRVTGTGFGRDHQRKFLNWATLEAKAPRGMGVFMNQILFTRICSLIML